MLAQYKKDFISFALDEGVLRFGEFSLKSGRTSPYFFNAGEFNTGGALARLGEYYAHALVGSQIPFDGLFGPAYKGIPLVAATSIAMSQYHQADIPYTFNRKEAKAHGEGGLMVGAPLKGRCVIIDDVITAGTAIREVMAMFDQAPSATVAGVMVAIDRQEKGQGELSAIEEVEQNYGVKVISVVDLDDIVEYLQEQGSFQQELEQIGSYRRQYGIASRL